MLFGFALEFDDPLRTDFLVVEVELMAGFYVGSVSRQEYDR